jgi:hypothetical protein
MSCVSERKIDYLRVREWRYVREKRGMRHCEIEENNVRL